jgi:hypothetical protein
MRNTPEKRLKAKLKHDTKILGAMHFDDLPTEDEWLMVGPKIEDYDDGEHVGLIFPNGIDPQILIDKIKEMENPL